MQELCLGTEEKDMEPLCSGLHWKNAESWV